MPTKPLPPRAGLDRFRKAAMRLLRDRAAGDPAACQRLREFHPRLAGADDTAIAAAPLKWNDALFTIAREYGFASWPRLKARVEGPEGTDASLPHHERIADPEFRRAVALIDDGDAEGLAAHLAAFPGLAERRMTFEGGNYFRNPPLLAFVAENPVRHDCLPPNIAEIARILLEAGAKRDKAAIDETLTLVASGRVSREAGVQAELIRLLLDYGGDADAAMPAALVHGEFEAAEALLAGRARLTLSAAVALGREGDARALFTRATAAERHLAFALAAQHGRAGMLRMLLDADEDPSRYNPPGAHSHSTPLHQAVWHGHEEAVRLLVKAGARLDLRDTIHGGTPRDWARHAERTELAPLLEAVAPAASEAIEAEALFAQAGRLRFEGDAAAARPLLLRAVALAREAGDDALLGRMLARLGQIERDLGDAAAALACYGEAADLARRTGETPVLAHRLRHIGDIHQDAGRLDDAETCYAEALALCRSRDDVAPLDLANLLRPLALLRERQHRAAEAGALWAEARALYEKAGVRAGAEEAADGAGRRSAKDA
jgi:tetratricopeptide (TPR) repeat protein